MIGGLSPILTGLMGGLSAPDMPLSAGRAAVCLAVSEPPTSGGALAAEGSSAMLEQIALTLYYPIGVLILGLVVCWIAKRDLDRSNARDP